jgi:HAD superfamily hydrolase (TIGR01509 family)
MSKRKAFLFDLNGTMIDDMQYHIHAWHRILNDLGANLTLERMKEECYGKNGELLERMFPGRFSETEKAEMSLEKERQYQAQYKPYLALFPGLDDLLKNAHESGIKMAIGSAAIMFNIDFVLDNLHIRSYFNAIVSADDVEISKPDPETYLSCASLLQYDPVDCIVFEDSTKGVESAQRAGMKAVVITSLHEAHEFEPYDNVLMCVKDYTDERVQELFK